jgi:dTDP-4-dehydrorhamnose reductase
MKCLITGGFGNLGQELIKCASSYNIEYIAPAMDILNITSIPSLREYVEFSYEPVDCIVHCAAYTNVPGAETDRIQAIDTNIIGTKNVINELCERKGVSLVYISSDYVYQGLNGNYKETDMTVPINFYALTKLAGEAYAGKNDLIIRTSFKPNEWKYAKAFDDLYTSADYIDVIADKISFLIAKRAKGIYNVGTERKSIYELAKKRNPKVQPISKNEIVGVQLPSDVSMNLSKYNEFYTQEMRNGGR